MLYLRLMEAGRGFLREGRGAEKAASSRGTFVVLAEAWAWGLGEKWGEGVLLSSPHWAKWQRESLSTPWGLFDGMWSYSPPGHVCRCLRGCEIRNSYTHMHTCTPENNENEAWGKMRGSWFCESLVEVSSKFPSQAVCCCSLLPELFPMLDLALTRQHITRRVLDDSVISSFAGVIKRLEVTIMF